MNTNSTYSLALQKQFKNTKLVSNINLGANGPQGHGNDKINHMDVTIHAPSGKRCEKFNGSRPPPEDSVAQINKAA